MSRLSPLSDWIACWPAHPRQHVLVQREVERGRFPLASIAPFSASQFGRYRLAAAGRFLFIALLQYLKPVLNHHDLPRAVVVLGGFEHQEVLAVA